MHPRRYFTLNFFIIEIFSVEKFPKYGRGLMKLVTTDEAYTLHVPTLFVYYGFSRYYVHLRGGRFKIT